LPATDLAYKMRIGELSAVEVMEAHLEQIARVNPKVNAIVTLVAEQALKGAHQADAARLQGQALGPLHGLPVAHKDLQETKGIRTTYGSPIYQHFVPDFDTLMVERLKAAGAITLGKTNTPEFGAGSQTFNTVFGPTLNPYDPSKTCGGSSGGAAVALACGMVPLADGSDLGGSLRNPASFCNVVGFRPSLGRVPRWPVSMAWSGLAVDGPMARNVADVALMLSAIAGDDPRDPSSIQEDGSAFAGPLERDFKGVRIAWLELGLPFEVEVKQTVDAQHRVFEELGCTVEDAAPNFSEADGVFKTLRAWGFSMGHAEHYRHHRHQLKDTVIWNIEAGIKLSAQQVGQAEVARTNLYQRVRLFMQRYEFLVLPTVQVLAFDVAQAYVKRINGIEQETYIDWMKSCYCISVIGHPAVSVPCGFSESGLPIGLQIVGRHRADFAVLQLAHAFEQANGAGKRRPSLAL
jgi:amidase